MKVKGKVLLRQCRVDSPRNTCLAASRLTGQARLGQVRGAWSGYNNINTLQGLGWAGLGWLGWLGWAGWAVLGWLGWAVIPPAEVITQLWGGTAAAGQLEELEIICGVNQVSSRGSWQLAAGGGEWGHTGQTVLTVTRTLREPGQ